MSVFALILLITILFIGLTLVVINTTDMFIGKLPDKELVTFTRIFILIVIILIIGAIAGNSSGPIFNWPHDEKSIKDTNKNNP